MRSPHQAQIAHNIAAFGQHIFSIGGDAKGPGFAYTVGNAERNLPELIIVGNFPPNLQSLVLNHLGLMMRKQEAGFADGMLEAGFTFPFKIRKCDPMKSFNYLVQAAAYYNVEVVGALQVMLCDKHGKYPGDEGVEPGFDVPQL